MAKKSPLSPASVGVDVLCEFLEVAWHQVLFLRDLYPAAAFSRRRVYGVSAHMCLHPDVAGYLARSLEAVHHCLQRHEAERVALAVTDRAGRVVEQHVFEALVLATPQRPQADGEERHDEDRYLVELEAALRASLLRLTACVGQLPALGDDEATFAVLVGTRRDVAERLAVRSAAQVEPWHWLEANGGGEVMSPPSRLLPINSFASEYVKLQMFVQTSGRDRAGGGSSSLDW